MARSRDDDQDGVVAEVTGGGGTFNAFFQAYQPAMLSSARMILTPEVVIEKSKFLFSARTVSIPLGQISGVSLLTIPNPWLILIGIPLIALFGLGLILILVALFLKYRFLVIQAANSTLVLACTGQPGRYEDFVEDVLREIERARKGRPSAPAAPPPAPVRAPAEPPQERVTSAPAKAAGGTMAVRCPECDKEYRIPANSAGKKFRCQACQAVIDVPAA